MDVRKLYCASSVSFVIFLSGCTTSQMRPEMPENKITERIIPSLPSLEMPTQETPEQEAVIAAPEPVAEPVKELANEAAKPSADIEATELEKPEDPPVQKLASIDHSKSIKTEPEPKTPAENSEPEPELKWPVDISRQFSGYVDGVPIIDNPKHCGNGDLEIGMVVENVGKSSGLIVADLHNDVPEDFLKWDKVVLRVFAPAVKGETKFCLPLTEPGDYAAVVYHDKNGNKSFDRNFLGIPKERFGATGNPKVRPRAPHYHEAAITVPETGVNVRVRLYKASDIFGKQK